MSTHNYNEIHAQLFDDHDIVSNIFHDRKKILNKKNIKIQQSAHSIIMKSKRVYLMTTVSSPTSSIVKKKILSRKEILLSEFFSKVYVCIYIYM